MQLRAVRRVRFPSCFFFHQSHCCSPILSRLSLAGALFFAFSQIPIFPFSHFPRPKRKSKRYRMIKAPWFRFQAQGGREKGVSLAVQECTRSLCGGGGGDGLEILRRSPITTRYLYRTEQHSTSPFFSSLTPSSPAPRIVRSPLNILGEKGKSKDKQKGERAKASQPAP